MNTYRRLEAWRLCHALALAVYQATRCFPDNERFGLVSQARRAAYSAAANIAEGSAKRSKRDFRRFLDNSLGSLAELSYVLDISADLQLLPPDKESPLRTLHTRASQVTWKLYASLGRRIE